MSELSTQILLQKSEDYLLGAMQAKDSHDVSVNLQLSLACSQLVIARNGRPFHERQRVNP